MALVTHMLSGAGPYTFRPSTPPSTTTVNISCSEWSVNAIRSTRKQRDGARAAGRPARIELDGPYGDNVIDLDDEAA
jgi:hypothetical protein